jgi:hypothetical protein
MRARARMDVPLTRTSHKRASYMGVYLTGYASYGHTSYERVSDKGVHPQMYAS